MKFLPLLQVFVCLGGLAFAFRLENEGGDAVDEFAGGAVDEFAGDAVDEFAVDGVVNRSASTKAKKKGKTPYRRVKVWRCKWYKTKNGIRRRRICVHRRRAKNGTKKGPVKLPSCFALVNEASKFVVSIREHGHYHMYDPRVYGPGEELRPTDLKNGKWRFTDHKGKTYDWNLTSLGKGTFALRNQFMDNSDKNKYLAYEKEGVMTWSAKITSAATFRAVTCDKFKLPTCLRLKNSAGKIVRCENQDKVSEGDANSDDEKTKIDTAVLAGKKGEHGGYMYSIKCRAFKFWGVVDGKKLVANKDTADKWEWFHPGFDASADTVSFFSDKDYTWIRRGSNGVLNTQQKRKDGKGKWHGPGTEGTFTFRKS